MKDFYEFAGKHPFLTVFLAYLAMITTVGSIATLKGAK